MKNIKKLSMAIALTLIVTNLYAGGTYLETYQDGDTSIGASEPPISIQVKLPSIQCGMCASTIENGLNEQTGILSVDVDVVEKESTVNYNPSKISEQEIITHITKLGYWANQQAADSSAFSQLDGCCQISDKDLKALKKRNSNSTDKKWKFWKR